MKKIVLILFIVSLITTISSCDYDDSNDIDIIKPNDSTETGITISDEPKQKNLQS
ncbi:hypothetical protein [Maribacter sp. ACAM166]|uniref:hypothetical protein n=1 Tax=Maribacter sp. ACAM166 TaxID=2508996 RepID=UPI0014857C66|nr:hypothetical protein [Maribacter sp. ACAM166]